MKTDLREYRGYILGTYEPVVTAQIAEIVKPGMTCMDIGAHHGHYSLLMSLLVGEDGRVYSFEPDVENYSYLKETVSANGLTNIECHNIAARERGGRFAICREGSSSMHKVLPIPETGKTTKWSEIEAIAIDDFVRDNKIGKLDFIKIDVEGSESEVLAGMQSTLAALVPTIFCEFHSEGKLEKGVSMLMRFGYCSVILRERVPFWVIAKPPKEG